jgi:hypothetical protein
LHGSKLGEAGKREKIFASAEAALYALKITALCLIFQKSPEAFVFSLTRHQRFWQNL